MTNTFSLTAVALMSLFTLATPASAQDFKIPIPQPRPVKVCEMKELGNGQYDVTANDGQYAIFGWQDVSPTSTRLQPLFDRVKLANDRKQASGCTAVEQILDEGVSLIMKQVEGSYDLTLKLVETQKIKPFQVVASDLTDAELNRERQQKAATMAPIEKLVESCPPTQKKAAILNDIRLAIYGPELNLIARVPDEIPFVGLENEDLRLETSFMESQLKRLMETVDTQALAPVARERFEKLGLRVNGGETVSREDIENVVKAQTEFEKSETPFVAKLRETITVFTNVGAKYRERNGLIANQLLDVPGRYAVVVAPDRAKEIANALVEQCRAR